MLASRLLPKEDVDAREVLERVLTAEGITLVKSRAKAASMVDGKIHVEANDGRLKTKLTQRKTKKKKKRKKK